MVKFENMQPQNPYKDTLETSRLSFWAKCAFLKLVPRITYSRGTNLHIWAYANESAN